MSGVQCDSMHYCVEKLCLFLSGACYEVYITFSEASQLTVPFLGRKSSNIYPLALQRKDTAIVHITPRPIMSVKLI